MADTPELTDRMKLFIRYYVDCVNATEAAISAGYSEKTAASKGSELRKDPRIRAEIDKAFDERSAGPGEIKAGITDILRSNMGDFLIIEGDEDGYTIDINLGKAKIANKLGLIRKIKIRKRTLPGDAGGTEVTTEFELYDKLKALGMMGKHHHILGNEKSIEDAEEEENGISDDDIASELA